MVASLKVVPETEASAQPAPKKWLLATHYSWDTDAIFCLVFSRMFLTKETDEVKITMLRSGEGVSEEDAAGFDEVLVMDTGLGELDQHGKDLERGSSFQLLCKKYGWDKDEAMAPFIELSLASDNVEVIDHLSLHYLLKGLRFAYRDKVTKEVDWNAVFEHSYFDIKIHYDMIKSWVKSRNEFAKSGKVEELANGVKISILERRARLREAAYEAGADVVLWTENKGNGKFYVGIQVNRKSDVTLEGVMEGIRVAEAQKRGVSCSGHQLDAPGENPVFGGWYLHGNGKVILCGSLTHELFDGEHTLLPVDQIVKIMNNRLLYRPNNNKKKK